MNTTRTLLLAALLPLAACQPAETARNAAEQATSAAAEALDKTSRDVSEKLTRDLAGADIDVGEGSNKAKISANGDLLIDGKPVPIDETQRALLLAHRANIVAVAETGVAIGMQGANLGLKAAQGALKSVFGGNAEEFGKQMEAEGQRIEAEALKICDHLPALLASQQALAEALPAFVPYATMDQSDVTGCSNDDSRRSVSSNYEAGRHIGKALAEARHRARGTGAEADAGDVEAEAAPMNAAAEADAAAARAPSNTQ